MKILLKKRLVGSVNNAQDLIKKLKHASQKKRKKRGKCKCTNTTPKTQSKRIHSREKIKSSLL